MDLAGEVLGAKGVSPRRTLPAALQRTRKTAIWNTVSSPPGAGATGIVAAVQLLPVSSARGPFQNTCLVTQKGAPPMM